MPLNEQRLLGCYPLTMIWWIFPVSLSLILTCTTVVRAEQEVECGLWLGPSEVKEREAHGFGLGMFTGRKIPKGTISHSELFFPVYDFDDEDHPPLREYLWGSSDYKNLVLESDESMLHFVPGLGAIAPCTSNNFNMELLANATFDDFGVHRSKDATAGSFTYHHLSMFRAVRDIMPGEELTVQCPDDDFDGQPHSLFRYDANDDYVSCLDDKLEEKISLIPGVGRGIFAKRDLRKDSPLLSSPAIPIHKKVLEIKLEPPIKQLLWNYCYGHPDSDLLWLPIGPLFNSVNHVPPGKSPNVMVRWHQDPIASNEDLPPRKQFHHPELLDYSVERVSETHGKGLTMDLVATRDIAKGEELYLDYGKAWSDAWKAHETKWVPYMAQYSDTSTYVAAMDYNRLHRDEPIRTITEQRHNPYPPNIVPACRFGQDWIDDEYAENYDMIQYQSWETQSNHMNCLLPCIILERMEEEGKETTYTAKLVDHHYDNESIEYDCHIFHRFEYIYTDIPRHGIEFVEKEYTSDIFLQAVFRQHIQVPDGMFPEHWMRQKLRKRTTAQTLASPEEKEKEHEFKRRVVEPKVTKEEMDWKRNASPRADL